MFQFRGFPTHTYWFSIRSMILHHGCSHIRKSADRSLFAAPRSLSQLVTSFVGSQCQGILHMLFFAWTTLCLVHSDQHNCSQFFIAWIAVCFILAVLEQIDLSAPGKIVSFYPFVLTKKPDFDFIDFFVFSLYFCLSCMSHWFFSESICLYLIRFSMNFSLTFIKLYSIMNLFITL